MIFQVYQDSAGRYRWRLIADNGEMVASSPGFFATEPIAQAVIARFKEDVGTPRLTMFVFQDAAGQFRWRFETEDGMIVARSGEAFSSRYNARRAAENVWYNAASGHISDGVETRIDGAQAGWWSRLLGSEDFNAYVGMALSFAGFGVIIGGFLLLSYLISSISDDSTTDNSSFVAGGARVEQSVDDTDPSTARRELESTPESTPSPEPTQPPDACGLESVEGFNDRAGRGDTVTFHYCKIDSSGALMELQSNVTTRVGSGAVHPRIEQAFVGMRVGELRAVIIPGFESYGEDLGYELVLAGVDIRRHQRHRLPLGIPAQAEIATPPMFLAFLA